jgi:hypothetical protein
VTGYQRGEDDCGRRRAHGRRRGRGTAPVAQPYYDAAVSRKVWYCAICGYEVNSRGRCHSCGERLIASPVPELESGPDDDEVGYRLDEWDDQTRARLIRLLVSAGVPHRFEDEELVVLAADEAEVDRLVARAGRQDEEEEAGEEARTVLAEGDEAISRGLYEAARQLREDPTDMQADVALAEASAAVFAVDLLPSLDEAHMAAVGRVTRRLLGALGADEALEDEIRHQSEILCRLVAPSAGGKEAEAEAQRARSRLEAGAKEKGRLVELPSSEVTPGGEMGANVPAPGATGGPEGRDVEAGSTEDGEETTAAKEANAQEEANAQKETSAGEDAASGAEAGAAVEEGEVAAEGELVEGEPVDEELEEDTGEIVYELGEWLPEQRIELSLLLESAGIPYNWDGPDLTVAEEHETEVEALFGQVRGLAEEDDEARYRSIEELFGSVDRLANDPSNEERQQAFLQAVGAVEQPTPVGVDDAFWWRVRSQGHAVVAALEGDARLDEVSRQAALLAEMLHEMV